MPGKLPAGWKLEPETEGTVRIIPGARSARSKGLALVAAGLGCCVWAGVVFAGLAHGVGGWRGQRLTLLLPLGLLMLIQGLRAAFGREEWWVGADRLEVRQVLLGLRRVRRFRGARLQIVNSASSASPRAHRLYRAAQAGGRSSRAVGSWWGLFASDERGRQCLYSTSRGSSRPEEIRALGEFLAERTGWPLVQVKRRGRG